MPSSSCVPSAPASPRSDAPHSAQLIIPPACRTNSPQTRHSRLAPRRSACSSCSSVRWNAVTPTRAPRSSLRLDHRPPKLPSELAKDPDDTPEDLDMVSVDWLHRRVLGLQPNAAVLAEEAFHRRLVRRLVGAGERDDDVSVSRVL